MFECFEILARQADAFEKAASRVHHKIVRPQFHQQVMVDFERFRYENNLDLFGQMIEAAAGDGQALRDRKLVRIVEKLGMHLETRL